MTTRSPASPVLTPPPGTTVPTLGRIPELKLVSEYEGCFGCGKDSPNGLRVRRTGFDDNIAHATFLVEEAHQGAPGLAHGGVLATAMDEITGTAAWLIGGGAYVTGRLETDFLMPVPVGTAVDLRAWCTGIEGRKVYVEGEGRIGPGGPVAVRAAALFIEVPAEHFDLAGN